MEAFHVARIRECESFVGDSASQLDQAKGSSVVVMGGPLKSDPDGPGMIQSVRFDGKAFTPEQAKAWLAARDFKAIDFEDATKEDSADGEEVTRFDQTEAGKVERTDEGFMLADAVVTRAGVFKYRTADGSVRAELRPPNEVFKGDSMKTAEMLPVTDDHPKAGRVTVDNAKELAVGYTGERVRQDGMNLRAPVKITTKQGIAAIEAGRKQLSLGYRCKVIKCDGEWNGEMYTHTQKHIRYNHLALVHAARAGQQATLRLDGADAVMVTPDTGKGPKTMGDKVRLDNGIEYDCAPEVAVAFDSLRSDHSETQSKLASASTAQEELKGKHDALEAEVAELKKRDDSAEIQKAVKSRLALVQAATPRLPKETVEKLDSMSDDEIQRAVILAKTPKADLKDKEPAYIGARFDAICEEEPDKKRDDGQGRLVVGSGVPSKPADAEQSRSDSMERARLASLGKVPEDKKSA